jgi:two-component system phosphate regulon sensor histidine kinase PhoR
MSASLLGLRDPVWRGVFARALLAGIAVAAAGSAGFGWGAAAAVAAGMLVATDLLRQIAPLRRRVLELGGADSGEPLDLDELARSVEETRAALQRNERKAELERDDLLGVLESTSEGILVVGHDLRVELINDAARRLLGPPVEPLGRALHEVTREPDVIAFAEALQRGEQPPARRIEVGRAKGARPVLLSGSPVPGAGPRGRIVVVLHDLTDLSHLERVRTDFVANVTHELRSPLSSILGYAETLADEPGLGPEGRDHLERILRNAHRLDDIVRDLIELSRLEHATAPQAVPTDVRALVEEVADAARDRAEEKGLALEVEVDALPPRLMVDPGLVHQALANLIDNAVKYTPPGGRVSVKGRMLRAAREGRELLELAVADTGPGIAPEHLARIFERFYRVDTARSRALGGTGLGLAIVKHAAALHGGRVRVESVVGQGSTFRVELAAAPAQ